MEAGVERAAAVGEVARRVTPVLGLDSACAHCLGRGRHGGGRVDAGFTSRGTQVRVEERARAHTAETGHPTRVYSGREQVTEFYIGSREEGPCDDC